MINKAEHWPAKQKARVLQSVEEVIRLRKEPFVKSVTVVMTNQNAGYGLPEAMDREMTFNANRLRDYGVRVIDSFPLHSETPKVDTCRVHPGQHGLIRGLLQGNDGGDRDRRDHTG